MAANLNDLFAGQLLATGPVLLLFIAFGTIASAVTPRLWSRDGLALPILTSLPILAYFVAYTAQFRVEANWLVMIWPVLALAGGWAATNLRPQAAILGWPLAALRWLHVPFGIALVGLIYAQALWQPFALPQHIDRTRDMRGWAGMQREVAELAEAHGAAWIATAGDYGLTGQLATYGLFAGSELPVRQVDQQSRWQFLPAREEPLLDGPGLFVHRGNTSVDRALRSFSGATPVGTAQRRQGEEVLETFAVYVVSGPLPETLAALTDR
jgi:hypothetical protein